MIRGLSELSRERERKPPIPAEGTGAFEMIGYEARSYESHRGRGHYITVLLRSTFGPDEVRLTLFPDNHTRTAIFVRMFNGLSELPLSGITLRELLDGLIGRIAILDIEHKTLSGGGIVAAVRFPDWRDFARERRGMVDGV